MGKRIAVLGTGANGAAIGADLTMAGLDVFLIDGPRTSPRCESGAYASKCQSRP